MFGWSGRLPKSCRGRTLIVPLNYQWAFWGWPNRLIARMEAHGGRATRSNPAGARPPSSLSSLP